MAETLEDLVKDQEPVDLYRVEKSLDAFDALEDNLEAALSVLVWLRCSSGPNGMFGALLHPECAGRTAVMVDHLETVGAHQAADAFKELRAEFPSVDKQSRGSLIDLIDANPEIARKANELQDGLRDVEPIIIDFLRSCSDQLCEVPAVSDKRGFLARWFG